MKKRWSKIHIKMLLIKSMREKVSEGLKDDPHKRFYANQRLDILERNLDSFNSDLKKFVKEYFEYLPTFKVTEQVCDNCHSNKIVSYEDVFVCQKCYAIQSFVEDGLGEVAEKKSVGYDLRTPLKNFRNRMVELDFFDDRLMRDYTELIRKIREDPKGRVTDKDFCLLCLMFKNDLTPPPELSFPIGGRALSRIVKKTKDIFLKLGWEFPSDQVRDYVTNEMTNRAKSSLEEVL